MTGGIVARVIFKATRIGAKFAPIRRLLITYQESRASDGWSRVHPIDRAYGIATSGFVPGYLLGGEASEITAYGGCQPSVIRGALACVENVENTTLVDLGCGKGRALVVASERPFLRIVGVEISEAIARIARRNVAIVRRAFPNRPAIQIFTADLRSFEFPDGPLALFLYHPFGEGPTRTLLGRIEERIAGSDAPLTIVFCNPVYGAVFDASTALVRTHAFDIAYDPSEIGYGPDAGDVVIVWRARKHTSSGASPEAGRAIVVTKPGWRVGLERPGLQSGSAANEGLSGAAG